jgi:tRNA-2-methylthio-N6-dimethylallyladenosine synthase
MHRGYNADRFLAKLDMARRIVPGLAVSTDIIVGFPGESEADFRATLDVVAAARFDHAFTFIFSPRPGTPAATMPDQVPGPVAQERYERLIALQDRIAAESNAAMVGSTYEVLTEGPSKKDPEMATARTRGNKVVHLPGRYPAGRLLDAEIITAAPHHLVGRAVRTGSP